MILDRKAAELGAKMTGLGLEFVEWEKEGEKGASLQKHHTQIRRVVAQLRGFHAAASAELQQQGAAAAGAARDVERAMLDLHQLWDFFRAKFALRKIEFFRAHLNLADEFAWQCYKPVQDNLAAPPPFREPPLVYFSGATSPFVLPRNRAYQLTLAPNETLRSPQLLAALLSLPVPVISIPWFQVQHLPDVLMLAHEVGHCVEDDFLRADLADAFQELKLTGAGSAARLPAWRSWAGEIFADYYGTLAVGPAFAGTLMDFLATGAATIAQQQAQGPDWGEYPTDYLRVLFALEALTAQGHKTAAQELRAEWAATFPGHAMTAFEPDVPEIVAALAQRKFNALGGRRLGEVISFDAAAHDAAKADAGRALSPADFESDTVRALLAATRLAFAQNADYYAKRKAADRAFARLKTIQTVGVRGSLEYVEPPAVEALCAADQARGASLFRQCLTRAK